MSLVYITLCAATFYAAFCRLTLTDRRTERRARLAFYLVAVASSLSIFGVLVWGHQPSPIEVFNQLAFAGMLIVSSKRWKHGVPDEYQTRPSDSL